jgi:acetylornithine/succinyldiaminopimelate/putrescine aminotransferase
VDLALQASMLHTKRRKFLSVEGAYHGNTLGALSVGSGDELKKAVGRSLLPCDRIPLPLEPKKLEQVERRLETRSYAAVILEPVICNLDVHVPHPDFMSGLGKLCRKYGTLLIIDEVATGFYRTGKLFAAEHYDISPDVLCLAKAITGGYGEMGATLMTREIASSMQEHGTFYSTYGWHPLSVEAALEDLKVLLKGRRKLEKHIAELSAFFHDRLREIDFGETPEISIKGLAIAVRFQKKGLGEAIATRARSEGLLVAEGENGLNLFPALTLDRATAEKGMKILERCARSH